MSAVGQSVAEQRWRRRSGAAGGGHLLLLAVPVLLVARTAPALHSCAPSLRLDGISGGGQLVLLDPPPPPCPCLLLRLEICADGGKPLPWTDTYRPGGPRSARRSQLGCARHTWSLVASRSYESGAGAAARVEVTTLFAGLYRPRCTGTRDGQGEPKWIPGLNATWWRRNSTLSVVQLAGPPRLSVQLTQKDLSAPHNFYLPRLVLRTIAPNGTAIDESNFSTSLPMTASPECTLHPENRYKFIIRPQDGTTFNCHGNSPGCPLLHSYYLVKPVVRDQPAARVAAQHGLVAYIGAGFLAAGLVVALLVGGGARWGSVLPPAQGLAPALRAPAAAVLLLHRGTACAADQQAVLGVQTALQAARVPVLQLQRGRLLCLLHTYPGTAELLSQPPLRTARLLFLATGPADSGACHAAQHSTGDVAGHSAGDNAVDIASDVASDTASDAAGFIVSDADSNDVGYIASDAASDAVSDAASNAASFTASDSAGDAAGDSGVDSAGDSASGSVGSCGGASASVCEYPDASGGGRRDSYSVAAQAYDNILSHVRNGRHSLDYSRVFAARLHGADPAALSGLPPGRLFTLPDHLLQLLHHLTAAPPTPEVTCNTETTPGHSSSD